MRNTKNIQWILMVASAILLITLSVFWLYSSYLNKASTLRHEANLTLRSAIFDLESSLRQENALSRSDFERIFRNTKLLDSLGLDSLVHHRPKRAGSMRIMRRGWAEQNNEIRGALSLHLRLDEMSQAHPQSLADSTEQLLLIDRIQRKLDHSTPSPVKLSIVAAKDLSNSSLTYQTKPYQDMISGHRLVGVIQNFDKLVWNQLLPEVLFSLIMLAITFAAFFVTHQNTLRQRKLIAIKDDLISNISHELQTPISTVKVALEAIERKIPADEMSKEYLQISKHEVDRLAHLVDKILVESTSSSQELVFDQLRLGDLIDQILAKMKIQFHSRKAEIIFESETEQDVIHGDKREIEVAITNLLDNALKYSPDKPRIAVRLSDHKNTLQVQVSDQGIGIPSDYQSKVFDRLFRVPTGNRHDVKGYGLGLSQVQQVMQKHGGSVSVESRPGSGSIFTLRFPRKMA